MPRLQSQRDLHPRHCHCVRWFLSRGRQGCLGWASGLHLSFTDAESGLAYLSFIQRRLDRGLTGVAGSLPSSRTFAVLSCQRTAGRSICGPHSETRARGRGATADAVMFSSSCSKTTVLSGHLKTGGVKNGVAWSQRRSSRSGGATLIEQFPHAAQRSSQSNSIMLSMTAYILSEDFTFFRNFIPFSQTLWLWHRQQCYKSFHSS